MPISVTFDTNTLERAVRPERYTKDPKQPTYFKIHQALVSRSIKGFFCETIVTLEGIQRIVRATVFGSTSLRATQKESLDPATQSPVIHFNLRVEQPQRQPIHPETVTTIQAALALGVKALGAPRVGNPRIEDPSATIYVAENEDALSTRLDRYHEVVQEIESRKLGSSKLFSLAEAFAQRDGVIEPFFKSLIRARNIHEKRAVERAVAEWADGDSIAAHIGYGLDYFCTGDAGKSAGADSIFGIENKAWLKDAYGTNFVTISELANLL